MKVFLSTLSIVVFLFAGSPACAVETADGPDVRFANMDKASPEASLEEMAWFEGLWVGTVFGGTVEHRVMAAHDGHMPGLVRLRSGETDAVFLYELSSFSQAGGTLTYRNRLFDPALETVGEGEAVTDRSLVAIEDGVAFFDGITFAPNGPDGAIVAFVLTDDEGRQTRHVVNYRRGNDAASRMMDDKSR
jgi:hypothetical protein